MQSFFSAIDIIGACKEKACYALDLSQRNTHLRATVSISQASGPACLSRNISSKRFSVTICSSWQPLPHIGPPRPALAACVPNQLPNASYRGRTSAALHMPRHTDTGFESRSSARFDAHRIGSSHSPRLHDALHAPFSSCRLPLRRKRLPPPQE